MDTEFAKLWDTHHTWGKSLWVKQKHTIDESIVVIEGMFNSIYFTYAYITGNTVSVSQLQAAQELFQSLKAQPIIMLNRQNQTVHLTEFLIKNGYQFSSNDSWMLYNAQYPVEKSTDIHIADIDPNNFNDFYSVLSVVFSPFVNNEEYLTMCRNSLSTKADNGINDFTSTFYVIYDNEVPAAGAGLFYSLEQNFAYLHNAGTLEQFRGKGYQSALIKHRIHLAQSLGINRIYSVVSQGSVSWANMIRSGCDECQTLVGCIKPSPLPAAV